MSTPEHPVGQHPQGAPAAQTKPHRRESPRRSHRGVWITLGSILGVLVLACGLLGYFVVLPILQQDAEISAAAVAASNFCSDLKAQNYSAAYDMFTAHYQTTAPKPQFLQESALRDQIGGNVTDCPIPNSGPNVSAGTNMVTLYVSVTRAKASPATTSGSMTLVKQSGVWKLDKIDDTLLGVNVAPLLVATDFCAGLVQGSHGSTPQDYALAYAQLSTSYQQQFSETDFANGFANQFKDLGPNSAFASCSLVIGSYKAPQVVASSTPTPTTGAGTPTGAAIVNVSLDLSVNGQPLGQPIILALTMQQDPQANGAWRIFQQQQSPSV